MNKKFIHPELIAPAGNLEKMKTAFAFGADAVYAGIPDFSLRVRINDFTVAKLKQAITHAHKMDKKVYVTINIFAHNRHIDKLPQYVKKLKILQPDALIASDPGVIRTVQKIWPQTNIHLSTQANCTNWQAAEFWHELGIKRVILGREVTINEIKEIHKKVPKLELECFVHGAMCMAYSGRCFLSKYLANRSANLGDCVQPCRWEYAQINTNFNTDSHRLAELDLPIPNPPFEKRGGNLVVNSPLLSPRLSKGREAMIRPVGRDEVFELVEEEHGSYILNSQDLCLIKKLDELAEAGVSSFKIEGRAKSVYYIANIVGAYAKAMLSCFGDDKKYVDIKIANAKGRQLTPNISDVKNSPRPALPLGKRKESAELDFLYNELEEKLYHRGYTEGFTFGDGKMAQNLDNSHKECGWEFCGVIERCYANQSDSKLTQKFGNNASDKNANENNANNANKYQSANNKYLKKFIMKVKVHNSLKVGDEVEIVRPFYDIIKMKVDKMIDAGTGEEINEAHGGQKRTVMIESGENIPEFSVIRRKVQN